MIPVLATERLILREPRGSDLPAVAAFLASDRAAAIGGPFPRSAAWGMHAAHAGQWILRGYGMWMVEERSSGRPIGRVGIYHPEDWIGPELGWSLFEGGEGHGYAHEAALAARTEARRRWNIWPLVSTIRPDNTRSQALARRLGCQLERTWTSPSGSRLGVWRHPAEIAP